MVFNRDEVVKRALASKVNVPNTCQLWTREIIGVASVGDWDGDGAADAEDGWKSEPRSHKHPGDRKPPAGTPVSYSGGSHDNGHRAISLGPIDGVYMIRSTDANGWGKVGTVPLDWPEKHWGLTYLGWSNTCDGVLIPMPPPKKHHAHARHEDETRGRRVDHAMGDLEDAQGRGQRRRLIDRALRVLNRIKPFK